MTATTSSSILPRRLTGDDASWAAGREPETRAQADGLRAHGQQPFSFVILGAGGRGRVFSDWIANHPALARVVAIAEPDPLRRQKLAEQHRLGPDRQYASWQDLLAQPRMADVVINTLMDHLHATSGAAAVEKGYHMLLEKPMATTLSDCVVLDAVARKHGRIVSVCHSLRYHPVTSRVKQILAANTIGRLMTFDLIEGVAPQHQAHSFVRGNWGNRGRSTFMLMAKSCHDLDLISWLVDRPCRRVASFGSLSHFRESEAPVGAPARCTDGCPVERSCIYSAIRLYVDPHPAWYADHAGMTGKSVEQRLQAMRTGPYGRCVYRCDNDVVDHQVVNFEFDGQVTGTFTMTAFDHAGRRLRLHGTEGVIEADVEQNVIRVRRFRDGSTEEITIPQQEGGHGGGDSNIMLNLLQALQNDDPNAVLTTTSESLESHKIAFAAERARLERRVVELSEFSGPGVD